MKQKKNVKRNILFSLVVLVLSFAIVSAFIIEDLRLINVEGSMASGDASILSVKSSSEGLDNVRVTINVDNLYSDGEEVFEAWLVDMDTGYKLSLGAFTTNTHGKESFLFKQKLANSRVYDKVVITRETLDDYDPRPSNQTALVLDIPGSDIRFLNFRANLSSVNENPKTNSSASGFGLFSLNKTDNTLKYHIEFSGFSSNETGAHIHGFSSIGNNSGVIYELPSGSVKDGIFVYQESQEEGIVNGMTYVNIHSDMYPNGEIRGQILKYDEEMVSNQVSSNTVNIGGSLVSGVV